MGHENISVTQRYVNQAKGSLHSEHAEHGPVHNFLK
jgi:hypothetical protein